MQVKLVENREEKIKAKRNRYYINGEEMKWGRMN